MHQAVDLRLEHFHFSFEVRADSFEKIVFLHHASVFASHFFVFTLDSLVGHNYVGNHAYHYSGNGLDSQSFGRVDERPSDIHDCPQRG
jgi:hypothetical protein